MADNQSQRAYRSNETIARSGQGKSPAPAPAPNNDPLAELARLIGQNDPFGEYAREARPNPPHPQAARQNYEEPRYEELAPRDDDRYYDEPAAPQRQAYAAPNYPAHDYGQQAYAQPAYNQAPPRPPAFLQQQPRSTYQPQPQAYAQQPQPQAYVQQAYPEGLEGGEEYYQDEHAQDLPLGHEHDPYQRDNGAYSSDEADYYDDVPPSRRRTVIMAIAGVFALAVIGTAGAVGYRAVFGGSGTSGPPPVIKADTSPSKIVPAAAKDSAKQITDRVGPQAEKVVSREEQPVDIKDQPTGAASPQGQNGAPPAQASAPQGAPMGSGIIASEPKKVRTIVIRPDQAAVADASPNVTPPAAPAPVAMPPLAPAASGPRVANVPQAAEPVRPAPRAMPPAPRVEPQPPVQGNAPLSLNPTTPTRSAATAPTQLAPAATGATGGYGVQVASQRSQAEAQAAFHNLQTKYPGQLGGKHSFIHKVDLGKKGVYYRAMVGPFANAEDANQLCSGLKSAGGQCFVQRN
jgi:hypothetical protein